MWSAMASPLLLLQSSYLCMVSVYVCMWSQCACVGTNQWAVPGKKLRVVLLWPWLPTPKAPPKLLLCEAEEGLAIGF